MATATTLSLIPSEPLQSICSIPLVPVSSSSFFAGGTPLWAHKKFISISVSSSSQFSKKISARRFGRLVVAAAADYYSTLGVPKSATGKEIKAAYRRLARQVLLPFLLLF